MTCQIACTDCLLAAVIVPGAELLHGQNLRDCRAKSANQPVARICTVLYGLML